MVLSQLLPKLRHLRTLQNDPNIIIVHCGANKLGLVKLKPLLKQLQVTLAKIGKLFPYTKIVWSCLLPRFAWRYSQNVKVMEEARARVNRKAIRCISDRGGAFIKHTQFQAKPVQLFHADGVHLSELGNDMFLSDLQGAVERLI